MSKVLYGRFSKIKTNTTVYLFIHIKYNLKPYRINPLFDNLNSTVINSGAKNTVIKYVGPFKRFMSWAEHYEEIKSVPKRVQ
jgi:hypothetical protein